MCDLEIINDSNDTRFISSTNFWDINYKKPYVSYYNNCFRVLLPYDYVNRLDDLVRAVEAKIQYAPDFDGLYNFKVSSEPHPSIPDSKPCSLLINKIHLDGFSDIKGNSDNLQCCFWFPNKQNMFGPQNVRCLGVKSFEIRSFINPDSPRNNVS